MQITVGACGYDYPEWVGEGRFYPAGLARSRQDWLTYYASQFAIAELNFTYYGETSAAQMEQMLKRVEPSRKIYLLEGEFAPRADFGFVIKAYAALTHNIDSDWRDHARKFIAEIKPLCESGKLLGVLAQFPSSAHCSPELVEYVQALVQELAPLRLIAEFRHLPWYTREISGELAAHGIIVAGTDTPREAKLPSVLGDYPELEPDAAAGAPGGGVAAPIIYIRLHGRREGSWWSGDAASRYEYNYDDGKLKRLAHRLLQADSDRLYVCFNNHRFAQAPRNAVRLQEILDELLRQIKLDKDVE
jgi:uncharacterized protein YecE (DUF72 family)